MTSPGRDSFASYLERLEALGFRPKRRFGQNFLLDPTLHAVIADAADLIAGDRALEIGGGLGFLTRELASRAAEVLVAEIDPVLAAVLRQDFADQAHVHVIEGDALGGDDRLGEPLATALAAAEAARSRRTVVIANLPYATSGPLLAALAVRVDAPPFASMGLLVQLEFARRLAASPRTSDYGSLTVLAQSLFEVRLLRHVGREVFRPRPNVDSAILSLRARPTTSSLPLPSRAAFARFVRQLFHGRRKVLRHALDAAFSPWRDFVPDHDRLASRRAEELDAETIVNLFVAVPAFGAVRDVGPRATDGAP